MYAPLTDLQIIRKASFEWFSLLSTVWQPLTTDVPELQAKIREYLNSRLNDLKESSNELSHVGAVVVGSAGSGKTHLLRYVRSHAFDSGIQFVLVDMTDVNDFWGTVCMAFLDSLLQPVLGAKTQFHLILEDLLQKMYGGMGSELLNGAGGCQPSTLLANIQVFLNQLSATYGREAIKHARVVRALFLLNSHHSPFNSAGYSWLQGQSIDEHEAREVGLTTQESKLKIVAGLSWFMSLRGPTIIAFDQLDPIVTVNHLATLVSDVEMTEARRASLAILQEIAAGLRALCENTRRSLILLTCLEESWAVLKAGVLSSSLALFEPPRSLPSMTTKELSRRLVCLRMAEAVPPEILRTDNPAWPFVSGFFESSRASLTPRNVLWQCDLHRQAMLTAGEVWEVGTFEVPPPPDTKTLQQPSPPEVLFRRLQSEASPEGYLSEDADEKLGGLLLETCQYLLKEAPRRSHLDLAIDGHSFNGKINSLHARIRLIYPEKGGLEHHFCLRVLQRANATAFMSRLTAAITASGLHKGLEFRRLTLIRTAAVPSGAKTREFVAKFEGLGGQFSGVSEGDVRAMLALREMRLSQMPDVIAWLADARPVSKLPFLQQAIPAYFKAIEEASGVPVGNVVVKPTVVLPTPTDGKKEDVEPTVVVNPPAGGKTPKPPIHTPDPEGVTIGRQLVAGKPEQSIYLDVKSLTKHVLIRAGAGGGKTVLVKRLVEEAALRGVSSIVVDCANDLAQLGDAWPATPEHWLQGDSEFAERLRRDVDFVVWTPNREDGRPLQFALLPDLGALRDDAPALTDAISLARGALEGIVAKGKSRKDELKKGVLAAALKAYAQRNGGSRLEDLISFLSDLTFEDAGGMQDGSKMGVEMAESLRAELHVNPLLRGGANLLDPAMLFGIDSHRPRVSIISLVGLPTLEEQRQFINQLAMTLFTWVKKHPSAGRSGITGLLVVDEAKDFVPLNGASCKASLLRLAAQGRKYGLGMLFATQNPYDLDYTFAAQCATNFFGRANAPQVIDFIKRAIQEKGGSAEDIGKLVKGQFYCSAGEGLARPVKVAVPMCLSHHPDGQPLTESQIMERARRPLTMAAVG